MANLLMRLFVNDLTGYEPRIVELEKPITIIGMSVDTTLKSIYRDVPRLGKQFKELKDSAPIPNEEEVLKRELPGYEAYMQKVKYRLLPGVW